MPNRLSAFLTGPVATLVAAGLLVAASCGEVRAGTTGKIAGTVTDEQGQPVIGATVAVEGTSLGAIADADGQFNIINVPGGTHSLRVTSIGFNTLVVKEVVVSSDQTTRVDPKLTSSTVAIEEVQIVATRPVVDVNLTSSISTVTSEEIKELPVQELDDVVNLQAGVVNGHFRGGREHEVQYQVDGVSINNAFDNSKGLRIDRSLLSEVQVISGTFDAEYGQAMSGVVNAVLKRGTESFEWNAEVYTGGYLFPGRGEERRVVENLPTGTRVDDEFHPTAVQNYQVTLTGPTPLENTLYLFNARYFDSDDYVRATRAFLPADVESIGPTGDFEEEALGYTREWSGAGKISNSSLSNVKLSYEAILNDIDSRRQNDATYKWRFNPDGIPTQATRSLVHGFDLTHTLSSGTFYNVSLRQNYFEYLDLVYKDVFDPRYDAAGPPGPEDTFFNPGAIYTGVDLTRVERRTNTIVLKGSALSQATREQLLKFGGEIQFPYVRFGEPGVLRASGGADPFLVRHVDEPGFPRVETYYPLIGAAFAQDQIEWNTLTIRAGVRFDYFDARATVPSDPRNPANAIQGAPESVPQRTSVKTDLSPRFGIAYPVSNRAAVHVAYGHFIQFPPIGEIFQDADYTELKDLSAGGIDYATRGNPDIEPEKTVQYEFGYKHAITDNVGADFTIFYKDIRDLLGVEFISTYNVAEYARLSNSDFGSVSGFTLSLDQRRIGLVSTSLDYTWQRARGNSSDPRETATRAEAGEDPRPRLVPFNWDQSHTLNLTLSVSNPRSFSVTTIVRAASGQPYTPNEGRGFFINEDNSGRKPNGVVVDLRAEKKVPAWGGEVSAFARVFNLFDARFFNGFVFDSTGDPYYSRFPNQDDVALEDPTRLYAPRRLEMGLTVAMGPRDSGPSE